VLSERSTGCRAVFRQGQGVSGSLCGTTLQQRRTRVAIRGTHQYCPPAWTSNPNGQEEVDLLLLGFRQFGLVPSVSVLADFALLGGRLFQGENTIQGCCFHLLFQLQLPHSLAGGCIRLRAIPASTLVLTQVRCWEHQFCRHAGNVALADFRWLAGLTVVLDHNKFTQQTLYGHLSEIFARLVSG